MKKILILLLFIGLGMVSFSGLDKVIIAVSNGDYDNPIMTGTVSRGGLANKVFGWKKDKDLGSQLYSKLNKSESILFIVEGYDTPALIEILKYFEGSKYENKIDIIEVSKTENDKLRKLVDTNNWKYTSYVDVGTIEGNVKSEGEETSKSDYVKQLLDLKKELK